MLCVKTYIHVSIINGIGLFAAEYIPSGTVLWKFTPGLDMAFTPEEYAELSQQDDFRQITKYIYKSLSSGHYILCADNARFMNHSSNPNAIDIMNDEEGITVAKKDIKGGEEITCDYALFDADYALYEKELIPEIQTSVEEKEPEQKQEPFADPMINETGKHELS